MQLHIQVLFEMSIVQSLASSLTKIVISPIFLHAIHHPQLLIGEIPNELATTHLHLLASRLVLLSLNIISNRQRIGDEIKLMVMCGSKIFEHLQMK